MAFHIKLQLCVRCCGQIFFLPLCYVAIKCDAVMVFIADNLHDGIICSPDAVVKLCVQAAFVRESDSLVSSASAGSYKNICIAVRLFFRYD